MNEKIYVTSSTTTTLIYQRTVNSEIKKSYDSKKNEVKDELAVVPNQVTVMNDTRCRDAWDKGCIDIMYMTIEYPNYPIIYLLTQPRENCVNVLRLRNLSVHFGT